MMKYGILQNSINGRQYGGSGTEKKVFSPLNGSVLGVYRESTAEDVQQAVNISAHAQKDWSHYTTKMRVQVHYEYRNLLSRDREELAQLCHVENGKSLEEAHAELNKAIELIEYSASLPQLISGEVQEVSRGVECKTVRVPLGVVASITPCNFPIMVSHWTVPNALAVGNAVILKPSELTPLSALKTAQLWKEAGLPDGLLNVLIGGKETVESICDNKGIAALTFVGSTPTAKAVYQRATHALKRAMTYGSAKNYMLVTEDAHARTADDIIAAFCGMAGQRCMAASVLIAVGNINAILNAIVSKARNMKAGEDIPPLITREAVQTLKTYLENAQRAGAKLLVDGRKTEIGGIGGGYHIGPSVIDWRGREDAMPRKEIFGPTLEILRAQNLKEAFALQNISPYGNGSAIFTQSGCAAQEAVKALQAGMIGINVGIPVPREPFSFGGIKHSRFGQGNITGWSNVEFFTDTIKITTKWNPEDKRDWMS